MTNIKDINDNLSYLTLIIIEKRTNCLRNVFEKWHYYITNNIKILKF